MSARLLRHGIVVVALLLIVALPVNADSPEGCEPEPITPDTPTGIRGCVVYGEGTASMWGGPGVARNDCVWPWSDCTVISVTSLETGITIIVQPHMFGDLYTGTPDERIVDLDPAAVAALGLDPSRGLWPVKVTPFREGLVAPVAPLPDTAIGYNAMTANEAAHCNICDGPASVLIPPGSGRSHTRGMRP